MKLGVDYASTADIKKNPQLSVLTSGVHDYIPKGGIVKSPDRPVAIEPKIPQIQKPLIQKQEKPGALPEK